MKIVKFTIT